MRFGMPVAIVWSLVPLHVQAQQEASSDFEAFSYTRVWADESGVSHFADAQFPLTGVEVAEGVTAGAAVPVGADGFQVFCFPSGTLVDWHPAPRRQFYFILAGELEMEAGDGEVRRFGAGDVLLGEATEGRGVRAQWSGAERPCVALAPLPER